MKNITITLDEEVARWARVYAARMDTSVSRMLGEILKEKMELESSYNRAMESFFARESRPLTNPGDMMPSREENDMVKTGSIQLSTRGNADVQDITAEIARVVIASELKNGTVTVFCPSATSALTTIEYESGCVSDLRRLFDEIIPGNREYAHNARWGDGNGHSHIRAALLGPSLTIPFVKGHSQSASAWKGR